jgi:hypothetical protein
MLSRGITPAAVYWTTFWACGRTTRATVPSDRAALLQQSEQASEAIELDEADTRLIIDAKVRAIGWQADTNRLRHALGTRPDPNGAIAVAEWPTESGPVDYALFLKGGGTSASSRPRRSAPMCRPPWSKRNGMRAA